MKRLPSNLSADDLRTYRRWTGGLYLSYLAAIIVAVALTFASRPASELKASNEIQMARSLDLVAAVAVVDHDRLERGAAVAFGAQRIEAARQGGTAVVGDDDD